MKRLVRKASKITLYHGTGLSAFMDIIEDGRISPRIEAGNVSHRGFIGDKIVVWYKKNEVHESNEKMIKYNDTSISLYEGLDLLVSVRDLMTSGGAEFNGKFVNVSDDLDNYIITEAEKVLNKYNLNTSNYDILDFWIELDKSQHEDFISEINAHTIDIVEKEYDSNVNEYVVFLGTKEVAESYAMGFANKSGGAGVLIEIDTNEEALGPDLNDAFGILDFFSDVPLWEQTYDETGQVVQYGPIDNSQIVSVTFFGENDNFEEDFDDMDFDDFEFEEIELEDNNNFGEIEDKLTLNKPISFDEAVSEVNNLY